GALPLAAGAATGSIRRQRARPRRRLRRRQLPRRGPRSRLGGRGHRAESGSAAEQGAAGLPIDRRGERPLQQRHSLAQPRAPPRSARRTGTAPRAARAEVDRPRRRPRRAVSAGAPFRPALAPPGRASASVPLRAGVAGAAPRARRFHALLVVAPGDRVRPPRLDAVGAQCAARNSRPAPARALGPAPERRGSDRRSSPRGAARRGCFPRGDGDGASRKRRDAHRCREACLKSAFFALAAVALGIALQLGDGGLTPGALGLLTAALIALVASTQVGGELDERGIAVLL